MTEDPATWSPMQRRRWAIELAVTHKLEVRGEGDFDLICAADLLERYLADEVSQGDAPSDIAPGLTIHQAPFGSAP